MAVDKLTELLAGIDWTPCRYCVNGVISETHWDGANHDRDCSECHGWRYPGILALIEDLSAKLTAAERESEQAHVLMGQSGELLTATTKEIDGLRKQLAVSQAESRRRSKKLEAFKAAINETPNDHARSCGSLIGWEGSCTCGYSSLYRLRSEIARIDASINEIINMEYPEML